MVDRFLDLVVSVYLYNEYRGYVQLDRLVRLLEERGAFPEMLAALRQHASDERKHYRMFVGYFTARGKRPYEVSSWVGYFDTLAHLFLGRPTEDWGEELLEPRNFARLCRVVSVTERRGIRQVKWMLRWRALRKRPKLRSIFAVIEKDEPNHFLPYESWLRHRGFRLPGRLDRGVDVCLHYGIAALLFPLGLFNPFLGRMTTYPHEKPSSARLIDAEAT